MPRREIRERNDRPTASLPIGGLEIAHVTPSISSMHERSEAKSECYALQANQGPHAVISLPVLLPTATASGRVETGGRERESTTANLSSMSKKCTMLEETTNSSTKRMRSRMAEKLCGMGS